MSSLRTVGVLIGLIGLVFSFLVYRGPKWNRGGFTLLFSANIAILAVSINPDILNTIVEMSALHEGQRGRVMFIMIICIIVLFYINLGIRSNANKLKYQFDLAIRKLSAERDTEKIKINSKPIMVLIPAYNESENLLKLLPEIPKSINGIEVGVLVVDDGSEDDTNEVALKSGCLVARNFINRGQGAASQLGYHILDNEAVKIVVTMDADNQHRPSDIKKLVYPIIYGESDVVIGSRIIGNHENKKILRTLGIRLLTGLINFIVGSKLTDCSSGFKAFDSKKLNKINLKEDQFQSSEVIIESVKNGLRLKEVPITIVGRAYGETKKGTDIKYGFNFIKVIVKTWWRKTG